MAGITFNTFLTTDNHKLSNYILTNPNQYFTEIIQHPIYINKDSSDVIQEFTLDAPTSHLTILSRKTLSNGEKLKMWAYSNSEIRFNLYTDDLDATLPSDHIEDNYQWDITAISNSREYSSIGGNIHSQVVSTWMTITNSHMGLTKEVLFVPHSEVTVDGINTVSYQIFETPSNNHLRIQANIDTRANVKEDLGITTSWASGTPTQADNILRSTFIIEHHSLLVAEIPANGDLRRVIYGYSDSNYVAPIPYASLSTDAYNTSSKLLKGTPISQLFLIESVQYPGHYLKYNNVSATYLYTNSHYIQYKFIFSQESDYTTLGNDYKFYRQSNNPVSNIMNLTSSQAISHGIIGGP
jgi:hypothetical protein